MYYFLCPHLCLIGITGRLFTPVIDEKTKVLRLRNAQFVRGRTITTRSDAKFRVFSIGIIGEKGEKLDS